MERLARFVNSPSVDERLTVKSVDRNGDEKVTLTVGKPFGLCSLPNADIGWYTGCMGSTSDTTFMKRVP